MPPVCPSCSTALDPTHAPVARIRGAKVVTYCSVACADAKPASVAASGASENSSEAASPAPASPAPASSAPQPRPAHQAAAKAPELPAPKAPAPSRPEPRVQSPAEAPAASQSAGSRRISASFRKRVILASGAIMAGGMAIAVVQSVSPSSPSNVSASDRGTEMRAVEVPPATSAEPKDASPASPEVQAKELRDRAIAELEGQLATGSSRFQRLAGMALARIGHKGAVETLGQLLESEDSDLSRIDIAYGLALAKDERGRSYLVNELDSKRRDVRIDAARRLVQLGDDSGRKALHQMLGVRSHRLGAASVLALLGDEKGLEVLRETFESAKSSDENRMRAAVGLGRAGDSLAEEHLIKILGDGKYVVDAAGALATLGNAAAVPALEKQLSLTALRVGAAESLQTMKQKVDIEPLASALLKGNAEGRIAAAEAILVLDP